tara:strand:- start:62 stop:412 length:351 start_codon:yes stop_codon:yes gene_type:complete
MINRAAIMLKYKKPAIDWINSADPTPNSPKVTLDEVNEERTVFLIRDEDADTPDIVDQWVKLNYKALFENELFSWYVDESLWPKKRTLNIFKQWFEVECHTVIIDLVGQPIVSTDA